MSVREELRDYLRRHGVEYSEQPCNGGVELHCREGEVFAINDGKGTLVVKAGATPLADAVRAMMPRRANTFEQIWFGPVEDKPAVIPKADRWVFVVHGHDVLARQELELTLHRMKMEPIVLQRLPAKGDTIIEKPERYLGERGNVGFACVLLTPDDEGHPANRPDLKQFRARQNVVLELGMVLARLGRGRVVVLHKGSIELPSDIAGLIYRRFNEHVDEVRTHLYQDLKEAGFQPDEGGLHA